LYYYLSKFLGPLLNPTNFLFIFFIILFIFYLISKRKIILKILGLNIFLIIIVAFFPTGSLGLKYLENEFKIEKEYKNIKNILVLSGADERIIASVSLAYQYPEAKVFYVGGNAYLVKNNENDDPTIAKKFYNKLNFDMDRINFIGKSRNTIENFKEILLEGEYWAKNILGNNLDQIYDYPLSHESFKRYPLEIRKKIKSEFIKLKKNKTVETSNFSQFIENQVGKTLTSMFFKDYPEKVWGVSTKKMTADWAPKRIKITKKSMPFFNTEYTAVAKFGTGTFYEKIRKKIEKLGGKIILNSRVVKLNTEKNDIKE